MRANLTLSNDYFDEVIVQSAMQKKGLFKEYCGFFYTAEHQVYLFDGETLYPTSSNYYGEAGLASEVSFNRIVGPSKLTSELCSCLTCNDNLIKILNKQFVYLHSINITPKKPVGNIETIEAIDPIELNSFNDLSTDFINEERISAGLNKLDLKPTVKPGVKPYVLKVGTQIVGIVSSHFRSNSAAMINTLYIKQSFRGQGLGEWLLYKYILELLHDSDEICLFFSSANIPASILYNKFGFIFGCDWQMIIRPGGTFKKHLNEIPDVSLIGY